MRVSIVRTILFFILSVGYLNANDIAVSKQIEKLPISKIYYLKDQNYKPHELSNKKFQEYKRDKNQYFRFPFENKHTYWIQFSIKNSSKQSIERFIHFNVSDFSEVVFYELDEKKQQYLYFKEKVQKHRTPAYKLNLQSLERKKVLIKISNHLAPTIFDLNLYSYNQMVQYEFNIKTLHGLFLGFMAFAICYFIIASIFMQRLFYIFYIIHILAITLFQFFIYGYSKIFFPEFEYYDQSKIIIGSISFISFGLFIFFFLNDKLLSIYKKTLLIIMFFSVLALMLFITKIGTADLLSGVLLLGYIVIAVSSLHSYKKGNSLGLPVFISSLVIILGAFTHAGAIIFQILPLNPFTHNILTLTSMLEVFMILLTFMFYLKMTNKEKAEILSQKIKIEKTFSNALQDEVARKTQELKEVNENLHTKVNDAIEKTKEQERVIFFQSKLATMGETINIIAHQWRQPIALLGSHMNNMELELRYKKNMNKEELIDIVEHSQSVIKHLSLTIDTFQNYLKPTKENTKKFNIIEIIEQALYLYRDILKKNQLTVELNSEIQAPSLTGNIDDFIQVILIIISNAKDALVKDNIEDAKLKIDIYSKENKTIIAIADNGKGIHVTPMEKVFEPYFTDKKKNGVGIGLFVAKNIIETRFNGELNVSRDNGFTTFSLVI